MVQGTLPRWHQVMRMNVLSVCYTLIPPKAVRLVFFPFLNCSLKKNVSCPLRELADNALLKNRANTKEQIKLKTDGQNFFRSLKEALEKAWRSPPDRMARTYTPA